MSNAMKFTNIASHLPAMAASRPHGLAVVFPAGRDREGRVSYTHLTFAQLDEESSRLARGLEQRGIVRGTRTVLMVAPSLDFFALSFALFKLGAIPILIDPGMGLKNLKNCLREAEPEAFIGIAKAHIARLLLRWPRVKILVTAGGAAPWGGVTLDRIRNLGVNDTGFRPAPTRSEDIAAILFTSGSTGLPKGAVYRHGNFIAQVDMLKRIYDIQPGEIDMATFPLFALFGPALGMTTIVPDMNPARPALVNPMRIIEAIDNFGVTNMFGSPALLDRVGRFGVSRGIALPSLKRVISAGAPVQSAILKRFHQLLSADAQIFTPYGATEALPVCSIGSARLLGARARKTASGAGICVGKPVDGMRVEIIGISDDPIESWSDSLRLEPQRIGEIVVKGPVVTRAYHGRDRATRLAKIQDPQNGGFYHRMGDLGYFDGAGLLWFCGRKSHRVLTRQGLLFTIPCEGVFNAHPQVYRTALVGVPSNGNTLEPVLCVELEKEGGPFDREAIRADLLGLASRHEHTHAIREILFHPAFPVDIRHNAKIFRERLAGWAARRLAR